MPVVTAKTNSLSARLATQFGNLKAQAAELADEVKKLTPKLKTLIAKSNDVDFEKKRNREGEMLRISTYQPHDSPYALVLTEYECIDISYKDEFERLYLKHVGNKKSLAKFYSRFATRKNEKLEVKSNPNYNSDVWEFGSKRNKRVA